MFDARKVAASSSRGRHHTDRAFADAVLARDDLNPLERALAERLLGSRGLPNGPQYHLKNTNPKEITQ